MPNQTITLTSASTNTSDIAALNWMGGKPTICTVYAASVSSGTVTLQYTLDDILRSSSPRWFGVSSGIGLTAPSTATTGSIIAASGAYPDGYSVTFMAPICGLRMTSTATNNINSGPWTMKVVQGEGG